VTPPNAGAATVGAVERVLRAATVAAQNRTDGVPNAPQNERMTRAAVSQRWPQQSEPVIINVSARTSYRAHGHP
jgi:hypothetical protein